jgi:hypothetical protein
MVLSMNVREKIQDEQQNGILFCGRVVHPIQICLKHSGINQEILTIDIVLLEQYCVTKSKLPTKLIINKTINQ